jgi:outer membrane immunogenic protein
MRKIILWTAATVAVFLAVQAALAADAGEPPYGAVIFPRYTPLWFRYWSGLYVGSHVGWGRTTSRNVNASGVFGAGQIGYNYPIGNFVLGIEGDGSFAHIAQGVNNTAFGLPASVGFDNDGLASIRGRFGMAFDNVLFYGTAGGGWGHGRISGTALGITGSSQAWHTGWTAGGGIEYAIVPKWSIKVEYLHYGLGSATYFGALNTGNIDIETFKVGVNYLLH